VISNQKRNLITGLWSLISGFSIDRKTSLLRDRPERACGQAARWMWIAHGLRRGDFFGSIPSSRCQTTRALGRYRAEARDVRRAQRCFFSDEPRSCWWSQTGSNRRPPACKAGALPTELWPRAVIGDQYSVTRQPRLITGHWLLITGMVGLGRFELPTSRLSSARSNQLSYKPLPVISDQ
jgi:hypothetical protein